MAAVVFTVDAETGPAAGRCRTRRSRRRPPRNDDVLIPFGSVDPHRRERRRRGASASLATTASAASSSTPTSRRSSRTTAAFYPIYEAIEDAGVPALFHTGHSGIGTGLPGGGGIRLKYSNPMYVDDVAVDFPQMKIVLAHPSFPWQDEAISRRTSQAAGLHRPVRLVAEVLPAAARPLRQHAAARPGAVRLGLPDDHARPLARGLRASGFKDEVRPLILKENAIRMLGLR